MEATQEGKRNFIRKNNGKQITLHAAMVEKKKA